MSTATATRTNPQSAIRDPQSFIALVDLPRLIPRREDGARVDFSTIWRWATEGRRGILLPTARIDGRPYTTLAAVAEFLELIAALPPRPLAACLPVRQV